SILGRWWRYKWITFHPSLTQSWLPMEKTEKDPVSGVWTVRNSGK
ncbi:hypothetical protein, partial [Escherichia coli]